MEADLAAERRAALKARLAEKRLLTLPGIFDMISAKVADAAGFEALYMTGYGTVASHLGLPDAGLASYTEVVGRAAMMAQGISVPLVADGDTVQIGQPTVAGASVTAKITGQHRGNKVQVFRYRPKKRIRVHSGHRQYLTRLEIQSVNL